MCLPGEEMKSPAPHRSISYVTGGAQLARRVGSYELSPVVVALLVVMVHMTHDYPTLSVVKGSISSYN